MIKINDKYKSLFEQPKGVRYYIITGGRGSSKSFSVTLWANLKILASTSKILFTRYTLTSAEISIIPEFTEKMELLNIESKFKVTKSEIQSSFGGEILFRGIKTSSGQQTANLKSLSGVNVWILDEAEELHDEKVFDKINLSIRHTEKQNIVILILNPTLKEHWIYRRFFEDNKVQEGFNGIKGDTCYIHTSYLDNIENLSESFLNEVEKIKQNNPIKYQNEILGGWLDAYEGVLFPKESLKFYSEIDLTKVENYLAYVDVATSKGGDYHVCVIGAIIQSKLYIVDVLYTKEDTTANIPLTAQLINKYNPEFCRIESNGVGALYPQLLYPHITSDTEILKAHTTAGKHSRLFNVSGWVKDNVFFKSNSTVGSDYHNFMRGITTYLMDGTSKNDDAPDSVWGLSVMALDIYNECFE